MFASNQDDRSLVHVLYYGDTKTGSLFCKSTLSDRVDSQFVETSVVEKSSPDMASKYHFIVALVTAVAVFQGTLCITIGFHVLIDSSA